MREICLRMAFMAPIGAPEASNALLTATSSESVRSPAGAGRREEPPPQISATTRSSSVSPRTVDISRAEAASPPSSGTG